MLTTSHHGGTIHHGQASASKPAAIATISSWSLRETPSVSVNGFKL